MSDRPITWRANDSKHNANLCSMTCEPKCHHIITCFETPSMHFQAHAVTAYGAISDEEMKRRVWREGGKKSGYQNQAKCDARFGEQAVR